MSDTISAAPFISALAPYIVSAAGAAVTFLASYGAVLIKRWFGIQTSQAALDRVTAEAKSEAGALVAAAANNLANDEIHVGSPIVADIVLKIAAALPKQLNDAGLTPDRVAILVAGEIGKLQASMGRVNVNAN
jgi:hypothetical protein